MARLILSRKGFDLANGGKPSPIWKENLISFPIPQKGTGIPYSKLIFDNGKSMSQIFRQLGISKIAREAHLDPDINRHSWTDRLQGWKASFGQTGAALSHLQKEGIDRGDLFLFFGWFKRVVNNKGHLRYDTQAPDQHIIFGYLEIGEMIQISRDPIPEWLQYHPHYVMKHSFSQALNTIFIAADQSSWFKNKPGAGTFAFSENRVLSIDGQTRTQWKLPKCFFNKNQCLLSYHRHKTGLMSNDLPKDYLQLKSASRGQEFVINASPAIRSWVQSLNQDG